jgi:DNA-directed RNA polymerase specialized sigma24 family protein
LVQPDPGAAVAEPPPAPAGFEDFYRASYRKVVRAAMLAGATIDEAEDAASEALTSMARTWPVPGRPLSYACTAAVNYFIKSRTRGDARLVRRLVERGHVVRREGAEDARLAGLEGREWIAGILGELTGAQREVMECIVAGLDRDETAMVLGISNDALRRRVADARARLAEILSPDGEFRHPRPSTAREAL